MIMNVCFHPSPRGGCFIILSGLFMKQCWFLWGAYYFFQFYFKFLHKKQPRKYHYTLHIFTIEIHESLEILLMIYCWTAVLHFVSAPSNIKHGMGVLSLLLWKLPQTLACQLTELLHMGRNNVDLVGDTDVVISAQTLVTISELC